MPNITNVRSQTKCIPWSSRLEGEHLANDIIRKNDGYETSEEAKTHSHDCRDVPKQIWEPDDL
jgi:hypothetical protein